MMSVTSVRLTQDVETPLEALAQKLDRSKNYLINQALREFIARHEEEEKRWEETLQALKSIREGKAVDGDKVNQWLQSWGQDSEDSKKPL